MTGSPRVLLIVLSLLVLLGAACEDGSTTGETNVAGSPESESVDLPFSVTEGTDGLLLTYADAEGTHTVSRPSEVPGTAREMVRLDSLTLSPEQRPSGGDVFVADLDALLAGREGAARRVPRVTFDAYVERAAGRSADPEPGGSAGDTDAPARSEVVLYGASWCGACRAARAFFQREGIAFRDVDIEREPGARAEMLQKARAAGVSTRGIPVIDFRGTIVNGFDERRIRRLM